MNTDQPKGSDFVTWQKDIATLEAEHCRAFVARDFEQLERLWSDDLLVNSPINRVHDKKRVLELLRAGIISHSSLECQAEAMMQQGRFVVVMGNEVLTNSPGGPQVRRRYTNIWGALGGSWQLVARHANVITGAGST
jgi:ketosteroid isomerase-like protein